MSTRDNIGDLIRERRLARGFSLGQLATRLGLTPATVRAWERGEDAPAQEHAGSLIEALELDEADLDGLLEIPDETEDAGASSGSEDEAGSDDEAEDDEKAETATVNEEADEAAAEFSDAAATTASVAADHETVDDAEVTDAPSGDAAVEVPKLEPEPVVAVANDAITDAPTEAIPAPVATLAPPVAVPSGYDVIPRVVAGEATPVKDAPAEDAPPQPAPQAQPPITVAPIRLPNPIRLLFDPHRRFLYWIRYALTIVVLLILLRVLLWAGGELWTALGDLLDTFRATATEEEEALRFLLLP